MKKKLIILENEKEYIKRLYGVLTEQKITDDPGADWEFEKKEPSNNMKYQYDWNTKEATPSNIRMVTLKGAYIETENGGLKFIKTPKVFQILTDTLYISIPGSESEYETAVYFAPSYMTTIVKNYEEFEGVISILKSMNKKFKKIVVGSHGSPGVLFYPVEYTGSEPNGGDFAFKTYWLEGLKDLVESPSSEVHFTECYGAEFLSMIKDAASLIGAKTYGGKDMGYSNTLVGSSGHIGNYFVCDPKKVSSTDFDSYYFKDKNGVYWRKKDFPNWENEVEVSNSKNREWWIQSVMTNTDDFIKNNWVDYPPFETSYSANGFRTYIYEFYPEIGKKYNVKTSDSSDSTYDLSKVWNLVVDDTGLLPSPSFSAWGEKGKTLGGRYMYYLRNKLEKEGKDAFNKLGYVWTSGYESRTALPVQKEVKKPLRFFDNGITTAIDFDDEFLLEKKYCSVTSQPSYFTKVLGSIKYFIGGVWDVIKLGRLNNKQNKVSRMRDNYTRDYDSDVYQYLDKK
jgi:hypothetical protein